MHFRRSLPLLVAGYLALPVFANGLEFHPYGFIKASGVAATRAVDTYGNANLGAPIKAAPSASAEDDVARSSFEVTQSRIGFRLNEKEKVSGLVELDFIDFAKASPVTKAVPRLRIANVYWKITDTSTLSLGQDWDTFSPGKPATFNYVGLYFNAGNAGFMRPQVKYLHDCGKLHFETALGLAGSNATGVDTELEKNLIPSVALQLAYHIDEKSQFGVSGLGGRLRFRAPDTQYASFYGANAFGETSPWEGSSLKAEAYYGQNMGNTGALTLAMVTAPGAVHEAGGFLTLSQKLGDVGIIVGAGGATVVEDEGSAVAGYPGHTIRDNAKASVAVSYKAFSSLDLFAEDSVYSTRYKLAATASDVRVTANVLDAGAVYTF